jgi:DNA primase
MSSDVERIKELLNVAEVVGDYIELKQSGSYYKANCPFHKEKTPSFIVTPERGTYHCFGCGASGDVFSFVQEYEGLDFKGALKLLADKAGIEISYRKNDGVFEKAKERLFSVNEEATKFFEENLNKSRNASEYLRRRGVSLKTQKDWRIGYAPDEWRALYEYLLKKNISEKDLKDTGLIKLKEDKKYDTFRDRLMFPIQDVSANVIAFSGRALNPTDKAPKYLNSPDTEIFNKSETLYGLDKASRTIRRTKYAVLVEGQFDLIMSQQIGVTNTVALSGTSVTKKHLQILSRFAKNILLAFDSDEAGIHSAYKTAVMGLEEGMDVKIAKLPKGKDPADCIQKNKLEWKKILTDAPHAIEHSLDFIKDNYTSKRKQIEAVKEYTFPMLTLIESEMDRSYFLGVIAEKLDVNVENVKNDAERYIQKNKDRVNLPGREDFKDIDYLIDKPGKSKLKKIIKLMAVLLRWLEESNCHVYSSEDLINQIKKVEPKFIEEVFLKRNEIMNSKEVDEVEVQCRNLDAPGVISYSDELVFQYKRAKLEEKLSDLQKKIKDLTDEDSNQRILSDYQKYSRELHNILNKRNKGELCFIVE